MPEFVPVTTVSAENRVLRRREFLALGSAGVLSVLLPAGRVQARSLTERGEGSGLAVGYAAPDTSASFRSARDLPAGNPALAERGVRMRIHGCHDSSRHAWTDIRQAAVDVDYPLHSVRFHAWQLDQRTGFRNVSSPVAFTVPITADSGLQLCVRGDDVEVPLHLTVGRETHVPKLCRGTYVLAFDPSGTGRFPAWSSYPLTGLTPLNPPLLRGDEREVGAQADSELRPWASRGWDAFPTLLFTVDHAQPAQTAWTMA